MHGLQTQKLQLYTALITYTPLGEESEKREPYVYTVRTRLHALGPRTTGKRRCKYSTVFTGYTAVTYVLARGARGAAASVPGTLYKAVLQKYSVYARDTWSATTCVR